MFTDHYLAVFVRELYPYTCDPFDLQPREGGRGTEREGEGRRRKEKKEREGEGREGRRRKEREGEGREGRRGVKDFYIIDVNGHALTSHLLKSLLPTTAPRVAKAVLLHVKTLE